MSLATDIAAALRDSFVTTRNDIVTTAPIRVPGIGAAAAYAANDTFGQMFQIPNVAREKGGTIAIVNATFYDRDNEGIGKVLHLFTIPSVTLAVDNAAWSLTVRDTLSVLIGSPISFLVFNSHTNSQTCSVTANLAGKCDPRYNSIWGCFQTLGVDNIAANLDPLVDFSILRD